MILIEPEYRRYINIKIKRSDELFFAHSNPILKSDSLQIDKISFELVLLKDCINMNFNS